MIPKIIHYCWFAPQGRGPQHVPQGRGPQHAPQGRGPQHGRGEMPQLAKDCVASWHKYMPDWDYKLWNEDNFDVNSIPYTKEAYEAGKMAFVTDYVRLYALSTEGGVYMDTDVEILKPLDDLLHLSAFTGYEGSKHKPPVTGLMASEAGGQWVEEQLHAYVGLHFRRKDGSLDTTTNTQRISAIMKANGFVCDGKKSQYKDLTVFPSEYFCPKQTTGEYLRTENTYCDHHFMGSWSSQGKKTWKDHVKNLVGQKCMTQLIKLKRKIIG